MEIQNIINSITTAELEAYETVRLATLQAKDIQMNAELDATKTIAEAKALAKETKKQIILTAQTNLEVVVKKRLIRGNEEGGKAIKETEKNVDKAVDFLVGRLLEQYVDC